MNMRKSRLSASKQDRLMEHFVAGTTARCVADLVGVNFKTAAYYYYRLRKIICLATSDETPFTGEIELDESYFGGTRKGKRGRGAAGKVPVFGILKRGGKVYTQVIPDAKSKTLMPIIRDKIRPDSIVYTDCWRGYNVLDVSEFKHYRINHSKLFANEKNHINGIENFWNQAKRHLRKFNGVPAKHFPLFLKECEWRFNNPNPQAQLKQLKQWVKQYMG
jgi:transposase